MSEINIFEVASRRKLQVASSKGLLSVEDLWDLKLEVLDAMAQKINQLIAARESQSFLSKKVIPADVEANLALEILKHIIQVKETEADAAKIRAVKAQQKATLKQLLDQKKGEALSAKSIEELQVMLAELG